MAPDRIPVLMYHRIDRQLPRHEHRYAIDAALFVRQMQWLDDHGWMPCTITAFAAWKAGRLELSRRAVLITFDDGFAGLFEHVFPVLAARGWPATVFLVSELIGGRDTWLAHEHGARGAHSLLGRGQIAEMARSGIEFHSHSASHADLTSLRGDELRREVHDSRLALEDLLGTRVEHFAYPFGRHNANVRAAVQQAGYELAFGVDPGFNRPAGDPLTVRRLDITGDDTCARFGRKVTLGSNDGSWAAQWRYLASRMAARVGLSS